MISTSHIHPMLVHFPIALVVFGFVADFTSLIFRKGPCLSMAGFYLLLSGTVMAIITLFSGLLFTSGMEGAAGEVQETHELFAWITLSALIVASIIRVYMLIKKKEGAGIKWLAFALYGLATISVSITGYFGGTLVYNYMMPL
jgi:uncharacterized membrane protein